MREFCELNGVHLSRFRYHWYKQKPADRALHFISQKKSEPNRFESIVIEPQPVIKQMGHDIELVVYLPNQIRCEISKGVTQEELPAFLKQLVILC